MTRPSYRTRPELGGAISVAVVVVVLHQAQPAIGSSALALVSAVAMAALLVNLVWAWIVVRRADVVVLGCPTDAIAGEVAPCEIEVVGARGEATVAMTSAPRSPPVVARGGERGTMAVRAESRGEFVAAGFSVTSGRPFGLVRWRRTIEGVPLPHPLVVSPRRLSWPEAVPDPQRLAAAGAEDLRAVRPFVEGDPLKLVHWPTTARSGQLVVRELEAPRGVVTVVVDLGDGRSPRRTEGVAGGSAWVVEQLLEQGWSVELVTAEAGGPVAAPVGSPLAVGRRLAVAVPGRPAWSASGDGPIHLLAAT